VSEGPEVRTATDHSYKNARHSHSAATSSVNTKSAKTAVDSTADGVSTDEDSPSSVRTDSTLKSQSQSAQRSAVSGHVSLVEDEKGSSAYTECCILR
jgi:hypothetical protein